jgi:hypothetical protein
MPVVRVGTTSKAFVTFQATARVVVASECIADAAGALITIVLISRTRMDGWLM